MDLLVVVGLVVIVYVVFKNFTKDDNAPEVTPEEVDTSKPVKGEDDLAKMTKVQIEEAGREVGVELDRRKTKANMIKDYLNQVKH